MASAPVARDPGASGFALRQDKSATPSADAPQTPVHKAMPQPKLSVTKSPPYRERRKEQVALPEQSTVAQVQDALDKLNTLPQETGRSAEKRTPSEAQGAAKDAADKK